jgi:hypothetical protein
MENRGGYKFGKEFKNIIKNRVKILENKIVDFKKNRG